MSGEKIKWDVEKTCKLIELYREARLLWDARHPDYKNRYKKADVLKEIGILCDTSSEEVDRKIKNINSQFQREHRNYQLLKKSGAGKSFVSRWFGYKLLSFLKDKNKPRPSGNVGGLTNTQESDRSDSNEDTEETEANRHDTARVSESSNTEETQERDEDSQTEKEINNTPTTSKKPKIVQAKSSTPNKIVVSTSGKRSAEVYRMIQEVYKRNQQAASIQPDDFDVFGELVARKLRKLRTPYAQATVQHLINELLYNAEIGKYDKQNNTETQEQLSPYLCFRYPTAVPSTSTDTSNHSYMSPNSIRSCTSALNIETYSSPPSVHTYSNPPSVSTYEILTSPTCSSNQQTTQIDESWPSTQIRNESTQSFM